MTDEILLSLDRQASEQAAITSSQPDTGHPKKKKKKKGGAHTVDSDGPVKSRSKKRKERAPENEDVLQSKKQKHSAVDGVAEPVSEVQSVDNVPPIDPELLSSNSNPSTSAFLSAVLAAASAMSEVSATQQLPPDPQVLCAQDTLPTHRYMPYPAMQQHPCDMIPLPGQTPQMPGPPFPLSLGTPLSEVSNEDILRALQDLDITKIASVLKTLNDAASAANISLGPQPGFINHPLPTTQHAPVPQIPSHPLPPSIFPGPSSTQIRDQRKLDMSLPVPQHIDPGHAHMLATKWLNASKLAELVRTEGLVYKKGKFSAIEERQLKEAIDNYCETKQVSSDQLNDIIFAKAGKPGDAAFWSEITAAVPLRPIIAVYHHVRRGFHPLKQQGKWMPTEDALLKQAVADLGQQWEKVSERVGRMSSDCRDRYRNHIAHREVRVSGQWSKEEEELLTKIVTEMTVDKGGNFDDDVFWGKVSERMENKRGRQQCRIKWTDSLSKMVKNKGEKPRWSQQDAHILVQKIDTLPVRDDTEIDWKTLHDPTWNLWSAHSLQRRWLAMKRSIKGHEDMTHQEIMDILRAKKVHTPVSPTSSGRKRRVISSVDVVETEQAVAGPSA